MTIDPKSVDVSQINRQQLQQWIASLAQQQAANDGTDYLSGWTKAKLRFPQFWNALSALPAVPGQTSLSNDEIVAQRATIPLMVKDVGNLYDGCSTEEQSAVWRKCRNSFDPALACEGFDSLVGFAQRSRGLEAKAAESDVRTRFPYLANLRDGIILSRKMGTALPAVGQPDNPIWSKLSGANTENNRIGAIPPVKNPFQVAGLGNSLDTAGTRSLLAEASAKHMKSHPGAGPLQTRTAVLNAHPSLSEGNPMPDAKVIAFRNEAVRKHMAENPGDSPEKSIRAVMTAHPTLAGQFKSGGGALPDSDDDDTGATLANSRTVLANSIEFSEAEKATAREALSLANENSRVYGADLSAVVQTSRGWLNAEKVVA